MVSFSFPYNFKLQMLVYVIHVDHYCLSISFVLVKYDQNVINIFLVMYYFSAFQPLFYVYFFKKLRVNLCHGT